MRTSLNAYAAAVAATATMVLLRWLLDPLLGDHVPFVTLYGAVAAAAWYGGYRPGLAATGLGLLACAYLFIPPRWSIGFYEPFQYVGISMSLLTCGIIVAFAEGMRSNQRRLWDSRELLRITFSGIGDAILTTDREGRIIDLNAVAESYTGWSRNEAIGQPLASVVRIVDEQRRESLVGPAADFWTLDSLVRIDDNAILMGKDGDERLVEGSVAPLWNAQRETIGRVLVLHDITERRKAEQELQQREALIRAVNDSTNDLIFMKGGDGKLLYANAAVARVIGRAQHQIAGSFDAENFLDPREHQAILANDRRVIDSGLPLTVEEIYTCADGKERVFQSTKSPLRDERGQIIGVIGVSRDITEEKAQQRQRDQQAAELALSVSRRAAERIPSERSIVQLEEAVRRRDTTLQELTERLTNVLVSLRSACDRIRSTDGKFPMLSEPHRLLEQQVERLADLIQGLAYSSSSFARSSVATKLPR